MYKYLSILLGVLILGGGIFYSFERYSNAKKRKELSNQIAVLEGTIKETETAYSKINDRDEEVVMLTETVLKWKSIYFEIKDATEKVVDEEGVEVVLSPDCDFCFVGRRFMVAFDEKQDPLRVHGHTMTNPPEATVNIEWIRDIQLTLILTKGEDDLFRIYLDSNTSDIVPTELRLLVDPSILDKKWYEKIGMNNYVVVGEGVGSSLSIMYDFFDHWSLGPSVFLYYDGQDLKKLYGISSVWYPFR
jgi:hypothetical protein